MQEKEVFINGRKISYFDEGNGQALIMVHGWSACKESFLPIINQLKSKFRLISLDLPGHGKSQELKSHSLESHIKLINDFAENLGIGKFSLFGTSFGGTIALNYTLENKGMVEKLIVQAPFFHRGQLLNNKIAPKIYTEPVLYPVMKALSKIKPFRKKFFDRHRKERIKNKLPYILKNMDPESKKESEKAINKVIEVYMNSTSSRALVESGLSCLNYRPKKIGSIKNKTLILWGSEDDMLETKWGFALNKILPNSELHIIKGASHFLIIEKPYAAAKKIREFLSS